MRLASAIGFGGLLVALTSAVAQNAAQPQPQPQPNYYPPQIYRMNDVTKSLNLTEQQLRDLNTATTDTQNRLAKDYEKAAALTGQERANQLQQLNQQYNTDWNKAATKVFNENQARRYQQLQYQYGGFNTFNDPAVQQQLKLTDEQRKALGQSIDWSNQQMQTINQQGVTDNQKGMQLYRDYQQQYQERMNKFLTPEQQKAWQQMTGEQYNFQPTFTAPARR